MLRDFFSDFCYKLLAMSQREIELGHFQDAESFFAEMDAEDSQQQP